MTKTNFSHSATAETIDLYNSLFNPKSLTLSPERERELIIAAQQCDRRENKHSSELISHVAKRCLYLAVGACNDVNYQKDFLIAAVECIYEAIDSYDLNQEVRFVTWLEQKVKGAFKAMIEQNEMVRIPANKRALCSKYRKQVEDEGMSSEEFAIKNNTTMKSVKEVEYLVKSWKNRYCDIDTQRGVAVSADPLREYDLHVIEEQIKAAAPKVLLSKATTFLMYIGVGEDHPMDCKEIAQKTGMNMDTVQHQCARSTRDLHDPKNELFAEKVYQYLKMVA